VTLNVTGLARGIYRGAIRIAAAAADNAVNSPFDVPVTLTLEPPAVFQDGVVNGASFAKDAVVSPGAIASLFGAGLAAEIAAATSLPLPTTLSGSRVLVNNAEVPLFFVSSGQINFQVPYTVSGATAEVKVAVGTFTGPAAAMKLAAVTPGIFTASPGGAGQAAALNQDFSPNSAQNPAVIGSVVQLFATGLGVTNPPATAGRPGATEPPFNVPVEMPKVLIDGKEAVVHFAAVAPGFVGLYQINAQVPEGVTPGDTVSIVIVQGNSRSNPATIAVRPPVLQ
jgi:uncharacterized protein (TIGR03437 family)